MAAIAYKVLTMWFIASPVEERPSYYRFIEKALSHHISEDCALATAYIDLVI